MKVTIELDKRQIEAIKFMRLLEDDHNVIALLEIILESIAKAKKRKK